MTTRPDAIGSNRHTAGNPSRNLLLLRPQWQLPYRHPR